jgi:hypothetical protein
LAYLKEMLDASLAAIAGSKIYPDDLKESLEE